MGKSVDQAEDLQIRSTADLGGGRTTRGGGGGCHFISVQARGEVHRGSWESFFLCFLTRAEERVGETGRGWD